MINVNEISEISKIIIFFKLWYFLLQNIIYKYLNRSIKFLYNKKNNKYNNKYNNKLGKEIYFIKNGEEIVIYNLTLNNVDKNTINENIFNIDYDFILVKDNNNIIRYKKFEDYINNKDYTITKKIFIKIKLVIDNIIYIIDLNNPNYYIVNNILFDEVFLKWYCKNKLNLDLDLSSNYYIIILDNNIKEYKLNKFYSLKLLKNNFEILNNSNFEILNNSNFEINNNSNFEIINNSNVLNNIN